MNSLYKAIFFTIGTMMLIWACSREKNTFTRRAYHSTTSHYNYYFNAKELLRVHLESIETGNKDDYNYIFPIFNYGTESQATAAYADMDNIIKKCSKLIDRHSMYLKTDEYNKWIDDSYILIGQAKFYKREYYGAIEIFEYVTYAFKGEPSYFEAKIWLARTYLEMEDKKEAEDILESIKEVDIPDEHKGEYHALYADLSMKEGDMEQAAIHLKDAVENTNERKVKRRYTYILAQIYHELKDYPNATKYYGKVLKMRPDYIMSFNAKLNQARSYDVEANNSDEIKKRLNRMLRDKKNVEFQDQIYFALAELSFREGDQAMGMEYLKKSATSSISNNKVKSEAYMLLGDIYYDKPKYIIAHDYYDSSMTVMPENHPKYEMMKERKEGLDDLVVNLVEIIKQDSLQKVAKMDKKERDKLIKGIIKKVEIEEERKEDALQRSFAQSYELANKRDDGSSAQGNWYFYNQSVKSFGVSEFKKQWGNRTYEDNWRRSDKSSVVVFTEEVLDTAIVDSLEEGITPKDPEYYLAKLPMTDSSMAVSHNKIINALYAAGNIFREQFQDYPSAIECFKRIESDYDTCRYIESSYYQLYRIYLIIEDNDKASYYQSKILTDYPFSEYARIIKNPEYLKNKRDRTEQVEAYYKAAYSLYEYKLYPDVIEACRKADSLFGDHHLSAKFDYLSALAVGQSQSKASFKMALEEVIAKHPSDDVAKEAQKIIDKMNSFSEEKEKREAIYKVNFRNEHILVIMSPKYTNIVDGVKMAISNYNIANVGSGTLNVSAVPFNTQYQMISVKSFKDKDDGMVYVQNISQFPEFITKVMDEKYDMFLISTENYAFFYQQKNLAEYVSFYNDHYLR